MKTALITGITGQDGSYLAEWLLKKGYVVHGLVRRSSSLNTVRIDHLYQDPHESPVRLRLHFGDMTDFASVVSVLERVRPDEIYNLAAQSHVKVSFEQPLYSSETIAIGSLNLLEGLRHLGLESRVYQASTSEMFGNVPAPQGLKSEFRPQSPYAAAKLYAHHLMSSYRDAYQMFLCNGILFNHESPRRGQTFVTRKITEAVARIANGDQEKLYLGNLDARRDWGYAPDYVVAMWLSLQQHAPDDYVIGTGTDHSVEEFLELAFGLRNLNWRDYVIQDQSYFRPNEVHELRADFKASAEKLSWKTEVTIRDLAMIMVDHDEAVLGGWTPDSPKSAWWNG